MFRFQFANGPAENSPFPLVGFPTAAQTVAQIVILGPCFGALMVML